MLDILKKVGVDFRTIIGEENPNRIVTSLLHSTKYSRECINKVRYREKIMDNKNIMPYSVEEILDYIELELEKSSKSGKRYVEVLREKLNMIYKGIF